MIGVIILFSFTLFLTHNYSPKLIGEYDFIRTFLLVLGTICLMGTEQSILYFAGVVKSKGSLKNLKDIYLKTTTILLVSSLTALIFLLLIGRGLINNFFNDSIIFTIIFKATICLFFFCLTTLNTEFFRAIDKVYTAELYRNTYKYLSVIIGAIYLLKIHKEEFLVDTFLIGFIVLSIISTISIKRILKVRINEQETIKTLNISYKEIIKSSYPMAISGTIFFLIMSFDIFFIKKYCGNNYVAFYSTVIKLVTVISTIFISVNINVSSKISELFFKNNLGELQKTLQSGSRLIFIICFPITVIICFFPQTLLNIFGKSYVAGANSLLIIMIGQVIASFFGNVNVYLNMTGRQKIYQNILLITLLIDLGLNILLVPKQGMFGAAIAFTCSNLFSTIVTTIVIYKKDKMKIYIH